MGPELRSLVVSGVRWKVLSQVLLQLVSFASTLVLARLLTPRDFGLAADTAPDLIPHSALRIPPSRVQRGGWARWLSNC